MSAYRKKPIVIEAWRWDGCTTSPDRPVWLRGTRVRANHSEGVLFIKTLEGEMMAQSGDWIIRGVKGELYPCKPDIFAATYEPADAHPSAIEEIAAERRRQIEVEGFTPEHDDKHTDQSLAAAATCYASVDPLAGCYWPWKIEWWSRRRDLIRAAALIVAEIERIDRAEQKDQQP